jgi:hypothetical protein
MFVFVFCVFCFLFFCSVFCIVLCIVSPDVYSSLLSICVQYTDYYHQAETKFQLIYIVPLFLFVQYKLTEIWLEKIT